MPYDDDAFNYSWVVCIGCTAAASPKSGKAIFPHNFLCSSQQPNMKEIFLYLLNKKKEIHYLQRDEVLEMFFLLVAFQFVDSMLFDNIRWEFFSGLSKYLSGNGG